MFQQSGLAHGFNLVLMRYLPQLFCFEVKARSLYSKADYISLLVNASIMNKYVEGTSGVSRRVLGERLPTGDTALSYFKSVDRQELLSVSGIILEKQVDELKRRGLLLRPVPVAFDWHDQMFYGDESAEMVNGTKPKNGSSYAYQYLTASIIVDGRRVTIALMPIKSREHLLEYVDYALNRIRGMGIMIRYLLFDGGFSSLALPAYLEEHHYVYAIRFTPNSLTKRMELRDGQSAMYPCESPFKLVRVDDEEKQLAYLFATNMKCRPKRILKRYKGRWGAETSYRMHNEFLAKTTSKNYTVRLLYYAVAVCIYNAWCLFNAHKRRHVITLEAKLLLLLIPSTLFRTFSVCSSPSSFLSA